MGIINFISLLISTIFALLIIVQTTQSLQQGFTTRLIHRDSPLSSLSNPFLNKYERLKNSIQRSMSRVARFSTSSSSSLNDIQSQVYATHDGGYIMELSFGTPPVSQIGIIDSGSDLIWTQCEPCLNCYEQGFLIFNPSKSSTYKTQSCDSDACRALDTRHSSCSKENVCNYYYDYGDKSYTAGDIATETITIKSDNSGSEGTSLANISFGCGHENVGTFTGGMTGIVGLGGGPLSLVSQLGSSIGGKFSYCLIPFFKESNYTSKISFGTSGQVSGDGVISTPLITSSEHNFYYLTLNGVTVVNTTIPFNRDGRTVGNIFIDSGTTMTYLPLDMHSSLISVLDEVIQGEKVDDPSGSNFKLCYKTGKKGANLNVPYVTVHFDGGDLVWKPSNMFVGVADDILCLAIMPSELNVGPILGNIAQINFLVGYDTYGGMLSFMPTDCTNH